MPEPDVVPFRVAFDPAAIDDLRAPAEHSLAGSRDRRRLVAGDPARAFVQDLARYWCDEYDFGAAEKRMNAWPQFTTRIDDLDIHFVHARSPEPTAMPLVITHGWPGSVIEFFDVLGPLTDPVAHAGDADDAFHVVCPSLPGFGFSDKPSTRGRGIPWMAQAWATLMRRLGYERFGAQGGDWGSTVTTTVGGMHRDRVVGIHVNMPTVPLGPLGEDATERERANFDDFEWRTRWGTGYQILQSTRPQTLGYGLVDSPVGQLAWIVEKFWAWTDCDGDPLDIFTRDQLLDNVTVYWFTGTGASSGRLYWESAGPAPPVDPAAMAPLIGPVTVPTGCSVFQREIRRPSRRWAAAVHEHPLVERASQGRPLRRIRATRTVRRRGAVLVPSVAMNRSFTRRPSTTPLRPSATASIADRPPAAVSYTSSVYARRSTGVRPMTWLPGVPEGETDWDRLGTLYPEAFSALSGVVAAAWQDAADPVLLELARLRIATLLGYTAELAPHRATAREAGLTDAKAADVSAWPTSPLFTARERACLLLTEQFVVDANGVTDAQVADVTEHLGAAGCYAFVEAVSVLETLQRACLTLGIHSTPGVDEIARAASPGPVTPEVPR